MASSDGDNNASHPKQPLVWIDLEMTGLDPKRHVIVEAACIVTDGSLEQRIAGPDLVISASADELGEMDDFVTGMHTKSGLLQRIKVSETSVQQAERALLDFISTHVPEARTAPLAGNSVHADRAFIDAHMPTLAQYLHYRNVDVSTVKELAKRWYPDLKVFEKKTTHRALSDIEESIDEMRYYRSTIFADEVQSPQ